MQIIPAIDLKGGNCVRLQQGEMDRETRFSDHPEEVARHWESLGATMLHIVDLDGARSGNQQNAAIVAEIARESGLEVQLGGGIRSRENLMHWLENGVTRCVVGSVAINEPGQVKEWIAEFGGDAVVLALDVKIDEAGTPRLTTHGWTEDSGLSLWDCLDTYSDAGAIHVLCTDVARDGAMSGPNFELYAEILQRYHALQLQASGGVRNLDDLEMLRELGLPAAITGRALLDGEITEAEVATFRRDA